MQTHLIFNPNARQCRSLDPNNLITALEKAGFDPVYKRTRTEADLEAAIQEVEGLIVVAGGDGSLRAVVLRILDRGIPLAILPLGTANNVANSLGIKGRPEELIAGLQNPIRGRLDIGRVCSPLGEDYFLESWGYGLFAQILERYGPEKGKSVLRGVDSISETLTQFQPHYRKIRLDGEDISGSYLIVEAHNTPALGPRVQLAPTADPTDGWLDVLRVHEDHREGLLDYVTGVVTGKLGELPNVELVSGKRLEIPWTGFTYHVDAQVRPSPVEMGAGSASEPAEKDGQKLVVDLIPKVVEVWLPQNREVLVHG